MNKITSFISKYYKHPIALVLYGVIIIYIIYKVGKSSGNVKPSKLPKDKNWGKDLTEDESDRISALAKRLWRDMDSYMVSVGFKDRDKEAYMQLMSMSDTEFVGVYNEFNDLYFDKGDGTLKNWISDESFTWTVGASEDLKENILQKMDKLNLK